MTTATLVAGNRTMDAVERPRRSLEELVDQLFAAMGFKDEAETDGDDQRDAEHPRGPQAPAGGGRGHRAGGAGRRGPGSGHAEGGPLGLLRVEGPGEAAVRRPGTRRSTPRARARAAALVPQGNGTLEVVAALGMRWRPGKLVSERSLRGLRPLAGGA